MGFRKSEKHAQTSDLGIKVQPLKKKNKANSMKLDMLDMKKTAMDEIPSKKSNVCNFASPVVFLTEIRNRLKTVNERCLFLFPLSKSAMNGRLAKKFVTAVNFRISGVQSKMSRGRAFVQFLNKHDADDALRAFSAFDIRGKPVKVKSCSELAESGVKAGWIPPDKRFLSEFDLKRLYVTGIARTVTQEELKETFPKATSINLPMRNIKGGENDITNLGIAHVHYDDVKTCHDDFCCKNNLILNGAPIVVNYAVRGSLQNKPDLIISDLSLILESRGLKDFVQLDLQNALKRKQKVSSNSVVKKEKTRLHLNQDDQESAKKKKKRLSINLRS